MHCTMTVTLDDLAVPYKLPAEDNYEVDALDLHNRLDQLSISQASITQLTNAESADIELYQSAKSANTEAYQLAESAFVSRTKLIG